MDGIYIFREVYKPFFGWCWAIVELLFVWVMPPFSRVGTKSASGPFGCPTGGFCPPTHLPKGDALTAQRGELASCPEAPHCQAFCSDCLRLHAEAAAPCGIAGGGSRNNRTRPAALPCPTLPGLALAGGSSCRWFKLRGIERDLFLEMVS